MLSHISSYIFKCFLPLLFFCFCSLYGMDDTLDNVEELNSEEESKFPLHDAVAQGDVAMVQKYLEADIFNINEQDDRYTTFLGVSCYETPLQVTRFIEDSGIRYSMMQLFLEHKADPNINYFYYPGGSDYAILLNIFRGEKVKNTILLNHCIKENYIEEVKLLLMHKADPNIYCSLHEAVTYQWNPRQIKSPELVELVLQHGADVNKRNKGDDTPLHRCMKNNDCFFHLDSGLLKLETLFAHDADIGLQDTDGNTIFHSMVDKSQGMLQEAEELLEKPKYIIQTLLTLRKKDNCVLHMLPKPVLYSIIKLAHPFSKVLFNSKLNAILSKKNKNQETAHEIARRVHESVKRSIEKANSNFDKEFYQAMELRYEKFKQLLEPTYTRKNTHYTKNSEFCDIK